MENTTYEGLEENLERFKNSLQTENARLLFSIAYKQGYDAGLNKRVENSTIEEGLYSAIEQDKLSLDQLAIDNTIAAAQNMRDAIERINAKKQKILESIVEYQTGGPMSKDLRARITMVPNERNKSEKYFLDLGKDSERFILEWRVNFSESGIPEVTCRSFPGTKHLLK